MADSIAGTLKDLGKETLKQTFNVPKTLAKGAFQQTVKTNSEEEAAKKLAEQAVTHNRIQQIEAEMAQIRAQNEKRTGPEIQKSEEQKLEAQQQSQGKNLDEASRQAVGRAEQGRNFKG